MEYQLLSLITHELKNPLTSIKGYAELLASQAPGATNPQQAAFLGTILANVERMARLLAVLNDYARLEAGRMELAPAPVVLADSITAAIRPLAGLLEGRRFIQNIPPTLPNVMADQTHLAQILAALIHNALVYSPNARLVELEAWQEASPGRPDTVHIRISDQGVGITPEEEGRLFESFYRSPRPEIRQAPGIGLSLHVVRRILTLMGGSITFQRRAGEGCTFEVILPAA